MFVRVMLVVLCVWTTAVEVEAVAPDQVEIPASRVVKIALYLAAGDYRRALEASQQSIDDSPSAASYIRLTYVYHAIDGYLEHLSKEERWMAVEHLYVNLAYRDTEDLIDPPGGLARMAKEMIQISVRQQADVTAAMAARLDEAEADRLWQEQTSWRTSNPDGWWRGLPPPWTHRGKP